MPPAPPHGIPAHPFALAHQPKLSTRYICGLVVAQCAGSARILGERRRCPLSAIGLAATPRGDAVSRAPRARGEQLCAAVCCRRSDLLVAQDPGGVCGQDVPVLAGPEPIGRLDVHEDLQPCQQGDTARVPSQVRRLSGRGCERFCLSRGGRAAGLSGLLCGL
jgi:hypothetical protein